MQTVLIILALLAVAVIAALAAGAARSARQAERLRARVAGQPVPRDVSADLPPIVRDFAIRGDARPEDLARSIGFTQEAEMQLRPDRGWQLLNAVQVVATGAPAFVWQAEQDVGPFPLVRVTDAYLPGGAELDAKLGGVVPVMHAEGKDLARGEAMRYLAELPWAPDAILGNPSLRWAMADDGWAEVSVEVDRETVTVRFRFDAAGDIVEFYGPGRATLGPKGETVFRDWQGYFREYRMIGPRRVPAEGEVGYVTKDGYAPYFQGRITAYDATH